MDLGDVERLREELAAFVGEMFGSLSRADQRRQGDCYVRGLMVDGRRKSIVPMAERLPDGNAQALQQFVADSPWDHQRVLRRVAERMCAAIDPRVWVVDDTSFPKCGRASVGVARQYCGALGKRANCQVGVSVHAATDAMSCPLQWRLFLPEEWTDDPVRRSRAGVPDDVGHVEKWRLALDAIDTLSGWGLVPPVIVADAGYGQIGGFRHELAARDLDFVVAVRGDEIAHTGDALPSTIAYSGLGPRPLPRYRDRARSLLEHAVAAGREAFVEVGWRRGSRGTMRSRFATTAVRPAGKVPARLARAAAGDADIAWDGVLPVFTLLTEWPADADAPTDHWLTNLPQDTPVAELVRLAKMRWRIEHDYRELKHGLGLDHYEGRTWRGWHHHVTLVTAAHAFLTLHRTDPKALTPA
ncbi:IS701 family transposase [Embleya sp. NPDC008237]|uniref:IS701 family transposase n=1 Tax=Embleya sp. NPDC008237 TaxID=3363978 RepID=UPI0036F1647A